MTTFITFLRQDMKLRVRHGAQTTALILFFLIFLVILPFAIGPDPEELRRLAPGLIWLAALLMTLLSIESLFVDDARDGTLDMLLLSDTPLVASVASRLLGHSLTLIAVILVMLAPAAIMLGLPTSILPVLALTFILGLPIFVLLGGIVSAITVGLGRNPALMILLLAPFYIPVVIFAVAACDAAAMGASPIPNICLLAAILAVLTPAAPILAAAILRQSQT
jgi:heme exporter protein B